VAEVATTVGRISIHKKTKLWKNRNNSNQSDGWFIGMVPNLVTGVWVGCEPFGTFQSITYGHAQQQHWGYFMKNATKTKIFKYRKTISKDQTIYQ
jgi:membrane peptidoglycan carboxypeptidase